MESNPSQSLFCVELGQQVGRRAVRGPSMLEDEWQQHFSAPFGLTSEESIEIIHESLIFQAFVLGRQIGRVSSADAGWLWDKLVDSAIVWLGEQADDTDTRVALRNSIRNIQSQRLPEYGCCDHDPRSPVGAYTRYALRLLEVCHTFDHRLFVVAIAVAVEMSRELYLDASGTSGISELSGSTGCHV
jgi:hypothetical protein